MFLPALAAANSMDLTLTGRVETAAAPYSDFGGYVIRADALGPVLAVLDDPQNQIGGLLPAMNTVRGELQTARTDDDLPVILVRTREVGTQHGSQAAT
ncbi:hypothetical protein N9A86_02090 [Akkermansiaceae bacterium]|nr:hypothetical protein [Akkermansiaceae bacterium]MDB4538255.1 hypothetical protein [Akkermansiaceae bacterium]